jgi:hypothetical protein
MNLIENKTAPTIALDAKLLQYDTREIELSV